MMQLEASKMRQNICRAVLLSLPGTALLAYAVCPCGSSLGWNATRADVVQTEQSSGPPPLVLDVKNAPRLDELPAAGTEVVEGPMANNSACYVCHANYQDEQLAQVHAKAEVGCVDCHGESMKHQEDEFHETPPNQMYALNAIDSMCGKCHDEHDVPATEVLERWQKRCPKKVDPRSIVCTDCHGHHRIGSASEHEP